MARQSGQSVADEVRAGLYDHGRHATVPILAFDPPLESALPGLRVQPWRRRLWHLAEGLA